MACQSKEENIENLVQVFEVDLLRQCECYATHWLDRFKKSVYVTYNRLYIKFPTDNSDNIEFLRTLSIIEIEEIIEALKSDVKDMR
jgi:hypothetical protein